MINLSHIQKFSLHDGPGIRTTIFLKGFSLSCLWCHNPETISALPSLQLYEAKCIGCTYCVAACPLHAIVITHDNNLDIDRIKCTGCGACAAKCPAEALTINGKTITVDVLFDTIISDINFYNRSGGGVTISGGEPLLQAREIAPLLEKCRANNIHTAVDTAGHVNFSCFEQVLDHADMFLFDLKIMCSEKHRHYTGAANNLIHDNLIRLSKTGKDIIIRVPLIPGVNDDAKETQLRDNFLSQLHQQHPVEYLPMHTMAKNKYRSLGIENEFYP